MLQNKCTFAYIYKEALMEKQFTVWDTLHRSSIQNEPLFIFIYLFLYNFQIAFILQDGALSQGFYFVQRNNLEKQNID